MKIHLQLKPNHPAAKLSHWEHTHFNYTRCFEVFDKTFEFEAGTAAFLLDNDLLTITEYPDDSELAGLWLEVHIELDREGCEKMLLVLRDVMKSKLSKQDKINAIKGCAKLI